MQQHREGRRPRKKLRSEEILTAASRIDMRGERVTQESLRLELGRGCNTVLNREARKWRHQRLKHLAGAALAGDVGDRVLVATNGSAAVFQVPIAIALTPEIVDCIMYSDGAEIDLNGAHVRLLMLAKNGQERAPLDLLKEQIARSLGIEVPPVFPDVLPLEPDAQAILRAIAAEDES